MGNEIILGNVKVFERLDNPYEKILLTVFSFFGIFIFLKSIISSAKNSSIYLSTIGLIILTGIMIFSFTNSWNTVLTIQVSIILISSIIYIVNNLTFNLSDSSKEIIALPISAVGAFLACISIGGLIGEIDTISVLGISLVAIAITINSGVASIGALISFFSISLVSFIFNLGLIKISIVGSFSGVFLALGVISTLKFYSVLMSDYIDIKSKKVEHSVARFSSVLIIIISVSSTVFIATSDLSTSESLAFSIIAVGIGIKMVEMFSGFMWRIPSVILIGFIVWIFLYVISVTLTISVENDIHHTVLVFFTFLPIMNSIFDFLSIGLTRFLLQKSLSSKYPPVLGVIDAIGAIVLFVFLKLGLVTLFVTLSDSDGNSIFQLLGAEGLFVDLKKNPNEYIWLYFTLFSTLIPTIAHLNIACFSLVATKSKYFSGLIRKLSLAILNYRKNINSASISFMALSFIITILIIVPLYSIYSIWMFLYGNHVSILEASLFLSTSWAEYLLKLI